MDQAAVVSGGLGETRSPPGCSDNHYWTGHIGCIVADSAAADRVDVVQSMSWDSLSWTPFYLHLAEVAVNAEGVSLVLRRELTAPL